VTEGARARGLVREAGGVELLERLDHLDRARQARSLRAPGAGRDLAQRPRGATPDVDVAIVGGGLWSLLAPLLAARGVRVAVLDRARVAASHREWNASGPELDALVRSGLVDRREFGAFVVARYRHGVCRFRGGAAHRVHGVLDHAVDAGALLAHGRALGVARGVTMLDRHDVVELACAPDAVHLEVQEGGGPVRTLVAGHVVDARGATSPFAAADLVCPTVGGVVQGLAEGEGVDEVQPDVGEILATIDDVDPGSRTQYVWEAFPGRPGEVTVYLFHYARAGASEGSLAELYARFFEALPRYKRGPARLVRPTFGFIPGWSRLTPPPSSPHPRVALVGDAAARHSPLTYCGFGAALRSLEGAADAVAGAVRDRAPFGASVVDDAPAHAVTGALATVMASRALGGSDANALLDAAFAVLAEMPGDVYARFLRDEATPAEVILFLRRTASRHPRVWSAVMRGLGAGAAARWGARALRSAWARGAA